MTASIRLGRAYEPLINNRDPFVFVEGPRGTAKTRSILSILLALLLRYPGSRLILCRKTRTDLGKTVLVTLEDQVFPAFGLEVPGGAHRENRSEYELRNGSRILPIGIDEGAKLLSSEATFAYVAEAIELQESQVTDVAGCMRWIQSPERPLLPDWSQVIVDANPGAPAHWVNQKAEPIDHALRTVVTPHDYERLQEYNARPASAPMSRWKRIVTKHQDNPGYWDHDRWQYTRLGQKYVGETLHVLTGFKRERWLHGLWKAAEGSVFPEFDEDRHVIEPFDVGDWPVTVMYDSGYDHPAALPFVAQAPDGQLFVCDEIYGSRMKLGEIAEQIKARVAEKGYNVVRWLADPRDCFKETAHAEGRTIADFMFYGHGMRFERWPAAAGAAKNAQVEALREVLTCPMPMQFFRTAPNTINEMQSWSYARNADGSMKAGDDAYEDRNNHSIDGLCGYVATRPTVERQRARLGRRAG